MCEIFFGTASLLRLYFRRDRVILPMWVLLSVVLVMGQISFTTAMDDWSELLAELSGNPLSTFLLGPIIPLTLEGAILWRGILQGAMTVMLGAAITAVRHSRTEEQFGRAELLLSRPIGRFAPFLAISILNGIACLVAGLLVSGTIISGGFGSGGAILAGITMFLCGWFFSGVGLVVSQIFTSHAKGAAIAALGVCMIPMMLNNAAGTGTFWAWLSPLAWPRIVEPYGANRLWPLFIFILLVLLFPMIAAKLMEMRDFGNGLVPQRDGRGEATPSLRSPLAFALKQSQGTVLILCLVSAFLGVSFGSIAPSISGTIGELMASVVGWGSMLGQISAEVGFMGLFIYLIGAMVGLPSLVIVTVQTMHREEQYQYAELILSRPVSRTRWISAYLCVAGIGCAAILLTLGLSTGATWALSSGNAGRFAEALAMCLSKWPVLVFMLGISAVLYGWIPKASAALCWTLLGLFIVAEMLWEVGFISWQTLSFMTPFAWAHYSTPIEYLSVSGLLALAIMGAGLCAFGVSGFKRRSVRV